MERLNIGLINQDLRRKCDPAYRATLLALAAKINELQEQVEELQNSLSEEIIARLAQNQTAWRTGARSSRIWASAGGSKRQPSDIPDTITMGGTPADSWLPGDVWSQYCAAVDGAT